MRHWGAFTRVAVVTESAWLRAAVTMFSPFFPGHVRVFGLGALEAAKAWTSQDGEAGR
jgi:hypothetical protein